MLRELGEFVERLQHELELRGVTRPETAIQIEIKCRSIAEWYILDQALDRAFKNHFGNWYHLIDPMPIDRVRIPHMLTYKRTPVRLTYD